MSLAIPVHLVDYDPRWPALAAHYASRFGALGELVGDIEHIGSTSIPGLIAKPVIDLMPIVDDLERLDAHRAEVEAIGLGWHGEFGVDGRRFCTLEGESGERLLNVHFYQRGSPHILRHLAFRDYLRRHPDVAAAYATEKRRVAALYPDDSTRYAAEKGPFIRATVEAAIAAHEADSAALTAKVGVDDVD